MRLKPRTIPIIVFSSLIIASVLSLTIFGFYAYLEWKENTMRRNYKFALYDLNSYLFEKYLVIDIWSKIGTEDIFKGKPIVWGTIKNTSNKKIYSLRLKISFCTPQGQVIYLDRFYPIGLELESLINISDITKKTENFLQEGDSISFKHQLKNCPPQVLNYLKAKSKFAKIERTQPLELVHKIEGLDIR